MLRIAAAALPAIILLIKVYEADRLEKESTGLLVSLIFLGAVSTVLAGAAERLGAWILSFFFYEETWLYNLIFYFAVVGLAEEGFKYLILHLRTWRSPHFNCQFDGVVYAVFVSLGFALWENVLYVLYYGMGTAVARAVTAVPGHACFGVFMGVWYGIAKRWELYGYPDRSGDARLLSILIPTLLHGCYDFIATMEPGLFTLIFLAFIVVMFLVALRLVKRLSAQDHYL